MKPNKSRKEFLIWCDESASKGRNYSNFYGGLLVESEALVEVQTGLHHTCRKLHLFDEIKWHKVSEHYLDKYRQVMDVFFGYVTTGKIRVRIMFRQNTVTPSLSLKGSKTQNFFDLYYQFIKLAFGLPFSNTNDKDVFLRLYFDVLPFSLEKKQVFIEQIKALEKSNAFQQAHLKIRKKQITEVDSKRHLMLQMLDVVLGAVCYRLNRQHQTAREEKPKSKRMVAKEILYEHILHKLRMVKPGFIINASTPATFEEDHWHHAYRHWMV